MEQYETFNRIYAETKQPLLRWLIPRIRDSRDVEDLMQEIYRKLYLAMQRGRPMADPNKYLFGIAKNELTHFYRGRARIQSHEEPIPEQLPDEEPAPDEQFFRKELAREAWTVVAAEPLKSYQAFTLYYGFDVPTAAIAKELGISEGAVRTRLARTRARIRAALQQQDNLVVLETERKRRNI